MSHLGSFGAAVRELDPTIERDTFDFFGKKFEVVGIIPPMLALQLGAATTGKIDEQEGLGAMWEAMRTSLTAPAPDEDTPPDDAQFRDFYRLAVAQCCDLDSLMSLALALFTAQSGLPTEGQSASSDGLPTTSPSSSTSSTPSPASPPRHPALEGMVPVSSVLGG